MADPTTLPQDRRQELLSGQWDWSKVAIDLAESECSAITTTEQVAAMYEEAIDLQAKQPDSGRLG